MPNPESKYTQSIIRSLPDTIYKWKIMNKMQAGIPDCYFSGTRDDLWVEFKWVKIPKKEDTKIDIKLSALQERWLKTQHEKGRNVCIIVGSEIGSCILRNELMFTKISKTDLCKDKKSIVEWITLQTLGSRK